MKNIYSYLLILSALSLLCPSCERADEFEEKKKVGCGDEQISGLSMITVSDYKQFLSDVTAGNATYRITYYNGYSSGATATARSYFAVKTTLKNICKEEAAEVGATLDIFIADSDITDTLAIQEPGGPLVVSAVTKLAGDFYTMNTPYNFQDPSGTGQLTAVHLCSFPNHGGWVGDSTYFFYSLQKLYVGISAKKPK